MSRLLSPGNRRSVGMAGAVCAVVLLAGCGSSGDSKSGSSGPSATPSVTKTVAAPSSSPTQQGSTTIHISAFKYIVPASVAPGATVSVMNMDGENHTVTADDGTSFDVKATAGTTMTFVAPTKPGSYPFHCIYHANMHGVLVVS